MQNFAYTPRGVCSKRITFGLKDGKVYDVSFMGGCPGNLAAISRLVEGMDVDQVVSKLEGIPCGNKPISCPDQLAFAVKAATEQLRKNQQ